MEQPVQENRTGHPREKRPQSEREYLDGINKVMRSVDDCNFCGGTYPAVDIIVLGEGRGICKTCAEEDHQKTCPKCGGLLTSSEGRTPKEWKDAMGEEFIAADTWCVCGGN